MPRVQIQTIGFLSHLRGKRSGPYLVVGPLSTLSNWEAEFKKWLPDCPTVLYHGSKARREELRRNHICKRSPLPARAPTVPLSSQAKVVTVLNQIQ